MKKKNELMERSERMIEIFNAFKGKNLKDFPVPPFSKWLNGKLIKAQYGVIELEFEVRDEMANPTGLLHGGMQCALMDDTIGMTTATLGYEGFPITIDFHVDYLGKVEIGKTVRVIGKIVREGRNVIHAVGEIYDKDGNLISTSTSNLLKTHLVPDYVKNADKLSKE